MPISDAPAGPTAQLASALQSLHALKGAPSVRTLARQVGDVSHTTVADALAGRRVPSWPVLEGIVRVLGGEQERFPNDQTRIGPPRRKHVEPGKPLHRLDRRRPFREGPPGGDGRRPGAQGWRLHVRRGVYFGAQASHPYAVDGAGDRKS